MLWLSDSPEDQSRSLCFPITGGVCVRSNIIARKSVTNDFHKAVTYNALVLKMQIPPLFTRSGYIFEFRL